MINFGFDAGGGSSSPTPFTLPFGSFFDTTQQVHTLPNNGIGMELNSFDVQNDVSINVNIYGRPTRITVNQAGVYNLQFSGQLARLVGGTKETVDIWIRVNENDIHYSATKVDMANNTDYIVPAWNWFVQLGAGEYVEMIWAVSNIDIVLETLPSSIVHPEIPSLITTICRVDGNV